MVRVSFILAVVAVVAAPPVFAQSGRLNIGVDQTQRVQLRAPAGSVVVGNPAIADVTVVDANTLFIVGKGYGQTEIVAVDPTGRTVFQSQVVVSAPTGGGAVRVWRGAQATEMACGTTCSPSVRGTSGPAAPGGNP